MNDVLRQTNGDVSVNNVTITGAKDDGFATFGGTTLIEASTFTGNTYGVAAYPGVEAFLMVNSTSTAKPVRAVDLR